MKLEEPIYFYLFGILPVLLVIFLVVFFWKKRTQKKFANSKLLQHLVPEASNYKFTLKFIFLIVNISLLMIALVNPKMGEKITTIKRSGIDIVFALDISKSMLSEDTKPNRLKKAKQIISGTMDELGSDRVGLIVYAGTAFPLLPITTDHASVKMFLQNVNPQMVSSQGTAINEALSLSKTYFNKEELTNKFLVIISDGEDHEEETGRIAEKLSKEGVKIYTIGIGTEKGGPIPIKSEGSLLGYKRDRKGETVITRRNAEVLKEIAKTSKGTYIDGNIISKAIKELEDIIIKAEKNEFDTKDYSDYKDQFQWFIGFGLLILLVDTFVLQKKTKWLKKLNLFNEKKND